jgi:formyltetrahydrofolate deformylase
MSPRPQPGREFVLTLSCPDRAGLVHAVTTFLVDHSGNILESQQFEDRHQDRFFMRVHFDVSDPDGSLESLRAGFGHCLNDMLFRKSTGALNIEIPAIVSNHRDLEPLARFRVEGSPFSASMVASHLGSLACINERRLERATGIEPV